METTTSGSGDVAKQLESIKEQVDKVEKEESSSVSEEEIFEILEGKGIEYQTDGGLILYVPPFRIKQNILLSKIMGHLSDLEDMEKMESAFISICDILAKILNTTADELQENCEMLDLNKIVGLMSTVTSKGNQLFKKKKLSVSFRH